MHRETERGAQRDREGCTERQRGVHRETERGEQRDRQRQRRVHSEIERGVQINRRGMETGFQRPVNHDSYMTVKLRDKKNQEDICTELDRAIETETCLFQEEEEKKKKKSSMSLRDALKELSFIII